MKFNLIKTSALVLTCALTAGAFASVGYPSKSEAYTTIYNQTTQSLNAVASQVSGQINNPNVSINTGGKDYLYAYSMVGMPNSHRASFVVTITGQGAGSVCSYHVYQGENRSEHVDAQVLPGASSTIQCSVDNNGNIQVTPASS